MSDLILIPDGDKNILIDKLHFTFPDGADTIRIVTDVITKIMGDLAFLVTKGTTGIGLSLETDGRKNGIPIIKGIILLTKMKKTQVIKVKVTAGLVRLDGKPISLAHPEGPVILLEEILAAIMGEIEAEKTLAAATA